MTVTQTQQYRDLERESFNQMMAADSRRVLGRYEEAAYHLFQAGTARARMGQLCYESQADAEES